MKLPKKVKAKWVAALRSGEYKQASGTMYNPETKGFCCLGVLEHCMLNGEVEKNFSPTAPERLLGPMELYAGLPSTKFWDGIGMVFQECDGIYPDRTGMTVGGIIDELAEMNDGGKSFEEIADYIEKEVGVY